MYLYRFSLTIGILMLVATAGLAQQPPDRDRGNQPERGFGGPPGFQLAIALDADADGKISPLEIKNATNALKKLDKDKDGKLTAQEIGWPPPFGGPDGGFGQRRGPGRGFGQRGGPGGGFGPGGPPGGGGFPGFGGEQSGPSRRPSAESDSPPRSTQTSGNRSRRSFFSVAQLRGIDRNKDGKITKEEIPKLMRDSILGRVDTNKDGLIDMAELDALSKQQDQ